MSSPKLERAKESNPGLAAMLDRVSGYIHGQLTAGQTYIIPKLVAASLRLNDGEAFVLLELLAKAGLLQRVYNVYCRKNDVLLETVTNLEALAQIPRCDECDTDHSIPDMRVQVAFRPAGHDFGVTSTR